MVALKNATIFFYRVEIVFVPAWRGRLRESSLQNVGNIVYNHLILRLLPVGVDNPSTRVAKSKTIKNPFCSCVRDDLSSPTVPTV